jgi:mRNA-degrading endonuclease toxin of MazEF toxin-antitoxin module
VNHGDLYGADLPDRGGREQRGRRPVVIWQDTSQFRGPTVVVIPLTTKLDTLKFSGTALIRPSSANGLSADSVAPVFQLGACDVRRLSGRLGHLDDPDLAILQDVAKRLQKLP